MSTPFVLSLCQELIRAPGLSGDEGRAAAVAATALRDLGYDSVSADAYGSVIGIRHSNAPGPTLLFDAHLDVIAVTNSEQWTHDPFGGELAEGRLWGRGACDDKGPLAAMICGVAAVPREQLRGPVIVTASVCEENVTGAALAHILDRHPADYVVAGEPTELRVGIAQKGRAGLVVTARGKSAHTSRPELGENAVYKMIDALGRLRALELPGDAELGQGILELTEMVSEPLPGAGFVPSGCRARLVERTMPGESQQQVLERLRNALAGLSGITLELDTLDQRCYTGETLRVLDFIPGWRAAAGDRWSEAVLDALRGARLPAETFAAPFGTNASTSAGVRGIPSIIYGPGSIRQAHITDEYISVEQLLQGERGYAAIVKEEG